MDPKDGAAYLEQKKEEGLDSTGLWQLKIALNMGLEKESLDILSPKSLSFTNREWLYIALMEQVPVKDLAALEEITVKSIFDVRQSYLEREYGIPEKEKKSLELLQEEVRNQLRINEQITEFIRTAKSKEEKAEDTSKKQSEEIARLKTTISEKEARIEELEALKAESEENANTWRQKYEQLKLSAPQPEENREAQETIPESRSSIKEFFKKKKARKEQGEFLEILKRKGLNHEQKNYLISCREAGAAIDVLQNIAIPEFEVPTMERIYNMLMKQKGDVGNGK